MQPFQQRVVEEKEELGKKLEALSNFFSNPLMSSLPQAEQDRLHRQHEAMGTYYKILGQRIEAFATVAK